MNCQDLPSTTYITISEVALRLAKHFCRPLWCSGCDNIPSVINKTSKKLWKSYPPDAHEAKYRGSAAFRGTVNQETKTLNNEARAKHNTIQSA